MKTPWIAGLSLLGVGLTSCADLGGWRTVRGSGTTVSEARTVSQFDKVSVSGSGQLQISQGPEEALTIEADDNLLPLIKSEVINGHLRIGPDRVNLHASKPIQYQLKFKNLNALHLSGSLKAEAGPLKTETLALHVSGSGGIEIGTLETSELSTDVSGSGDTHVAGRARVQRISISGSGIHQASNLECNEATVGISGSGHAALWVKEALTANISGSGEVEYYGSPRIASHTSGSGRVRSRGDK
jgi:hypothetical protein